MATRTKNEMMTRQDPSFDYTSSDYQDISTLVIFSRNTHRGEASFLGAPSLVNN